jgi:tetratricopeptide (TPR) repeat protein
MGKSFDHASLQKTAANFNQKHVVYDTINDYYYEPFFKNDTMLLREYRLQGKDTVHLRVQQINYIIGSGQHTNSHLYNINGYVYQAPITYYAQEKKWDLAPGFEQGTNTRFKRIITDECMSCHNAYPSVEAASENKYKEIKQGIDCERCHGPGSIHAQLKKDGVLADTTGTNYDYSIVNPRGLNRELQIDVCQRCHLQGVSVLKENQDFHSYKPGMNLNDVMNVFLPRYTDSDERFLMASHADRMKQSKCFKQSDMTCITCHNPHESVKTKNIDYWINKCNTCHTDRSRCSETKANIEAKKGNCIECHMPLSSTIDIPHVQIHNHAIIRTIPIKNATEIRNFIALECVTNSNISSLEQANGYLAFYEEYTTLPAFLDSAVSYYNRSNTNDADTYIHIKYLQKNWNEIVNYVAKNKLENKKPWTMYRVGEAYLMLENYIEALVYFNKALQKKGLNLDFLTKKAIALTQLNKISEAKEIYQNIIIENPQYSIAYCNLGVISMNEGELLKANEYYNKALQYDPDYLQAMINKTNLLMLQNNKNEARNYLKIIEKKYPNNEEVIKLIQKSKYL